MAWTETYHCDVCGTAKNEGQHDWWLAFVDKTSPTPMSKEQPMLRITPWNDFLSHSAGVQHLCGARCTQTELDRWMSSTMEHLQS
jgi:hypothetical protein